MTEAIEFLVIAVIFGGPVICLGALVGKSYEKNQNDSPRRPSLKKHLTGGYRPALTPKGGEGAGRRPASVLMKEFSLAAVVREETVKYGTTNAEKAGLLATILGDVPNETLNLFTGMPLKELASMTEEELQAFPGMTRLKAVRITAVFELARRLASTATKDLPEITTPEIVANLVMEEMRHLDREHFWTLLLNTKRKVLAREVVSIGTLNFSAIHPRELFKSAIKRSAAGIILVHNHPSGDPTPSRQDIEATRRLMEAGDIVGIEVLDHLVIGNNRFTSFKSKGLM